MWRGGGLHNLPAEQALKGGEGSQPKRISQRGGDNPPLPANETRSDTGNKKRGNRPGWRKKGMAGREAKKGEGGTRRHKHAPKREWRTTINPLSLLPLPSSCPPLRNHPEKTPAPLDPVRVRNGTRNQASSTRSASPKRLNNTKTTPIFTRSFASPHLSPSSL